MHLGASKAHRPASHRLPKLHVPRRTWMHHAHHAPDHCNPVSGGTRNGDAPAFSREKKLVKSANRLEAMAAVSTVLGWHSPIQCVSDAFCPSSSHQTRLLAFSWRCPNHLKPSVFEQWNVSRKKDSASGMVVFGIYLHPNPAICLPHSITMLSYFKP